MPRAPDVTCPACIETAGDRPTSRLALTEESVTIVEPAVVQLLEKHTDLLESARAGTAGFDHGDAHTRRRELPGDGRADDADAYDDGVH